MNLGFETAPTTSDPIPAWTGLGSVSLVTTENGLAPLQGSNQVAFAATGINRISQTVAVCPGTTRLTLTAWSRRTSTGSCTLTLCIGTLCRGFALGTVYTAYGLTAVVADSPVISAAIACLGTDSPKGYLDFVTIGY